MKFRPCIDIHNGKVKQIIGGSLQDAGDYAKENFVSDKNADFYADFYAGDGLSGGHIIMLNPSTSPYYEETKRQAVLALKSQPQRWQIGGGIRRENAETFLRAGASQVIVTSYVFQDGKIQYENLEKLVREVGKEHLVLDLSCRKKEGEYYIVTDRWQKFTEVRLCKEVLEELSGSCSEFLVHAADVEGKARGIESRVAQVLGEWGEIPMTYAGGIGSPEDIRKLREEGRGKLDLTVGSALDLFGGSLSYREVLSLCQG